MKMTNTYEVGTMKEATLKALNASIVKWKERAAGKHSPPSPEACPLCDEFFDDLCDGCPVAGPEMENEGCLFTPCPAYAREIKTRDITLCDSLLRCYAQAEVDFLESLLPQVE